MAVGWERGAERGRAHGQGRSITIGVVVFLAAIATVGCTRASAASGPVPPTYIPQPTPDPTMAVVIQGGGQPVSYLPPLDMKGSPTPVPAAARPASSGASSSGASSSGASNARPAAKPAPAAAPTRDTTPARETAPAPRPTAVPAPREPAPAPKPAAKPAPTANPGSGGTSGSGTSGGGAPAVINPNTVLPGGTRPNPTPAR